MGDRKSWSEREIDEMRGFRLHTFSSSNETHPLLKRVFFLRLLTLQGMSYWFHDDPSHGTNKL